MNRAGGGEQEQGDRRDTTNHDEAWERQKPAPGVKQAWVAVAAAVQRLCQHRVVPAPRTPGHLMPHGLRCCASSGRLTQHGIRLGHAAESSVPGGISGCAVRMQAQGEALIGAMHLLWRTLGGDAEDFTSLMVIQDSLPRTYDAAVHRASAPAVGRSVCFHRYDALLMSVDAHPLGCQRVRRVRHWQPDAEFASEAPAAGEPLRGSGSRR